MWGLAAVLVVLVAGIVFLLTRRNVHPDGAAVTVLREQLEKADKDFVLLREQLRQEQERRVTAETRLAEAVKNIEEQRQLLGETEQRLREAFVALSSEALSENNQAFLMLAKQSFEKVMVETRGEFGQREKAIKGIVDPLAKALDDLRDQVGLFEQSRSKDQGALQEHLRLLTQAEQELRSQTEHLVTALQTPNVGGQWGEMTLRRVVELAGMSDHCDFTEQVSIMAEGTVRLRPDVVVNLPGGRCVVVDAKTSLSAYLTAVEAKTEEERESALKLHAEQLRQHLRELSSKEYWGQFRTSPEFVVMFIPGESFFSAAMKYDRSLLEDGMGNQVVLASPATLIALLKAVAFGWRQEQFARSAQVVADLGREIYSRFLTYLEHVRRMGSSLGQSVQSYNQMVGSLETRVLPGLRRFRELGATGEKEIGPAEPVEQLPREVSIREQISSHVEGA